MSSQLDSTHHAPLSAALEAGRALGAELPADIDVLGIVIERGGVLGAESSEAIEAAVPVAMSAVDQALRERPPGSPQREPVHA